MRNVIVSSSFDDLKSHEMRFLQETQKLGKVHVLPWPDETVRQETGSAPVFPLAERYYMVEAIRYVTRVIIPMSDYRPGTLPAGENFDAWASMNDNPAERKFCEKHQIEYVVIGPEATKGFPEDVRPAPVTGKTVLVTGCFDWFHSGHIRFFEEVSELGHLYVIVGHDENVRLLKGEGRPLFSEQERRYYCGSIRHVHQALVSTGDGWLDAEPEIRRLRPDIYAVNEDGDKKEKREFCAENGIEYVVLRRSPKEGLEGRSSTGLRGY